MIKGKDEVVYVRHNNKTESEKKLEKDLAKKFDSKTDDYDPEKEKLLKQAMDQVKQAFENDEPISLSTIGESGVSLFTIGGEYEQVSLALSNLTYIVNKLIDVKPDSSELFEILKKVVSDFMGEHTHDK